MPQILELAQLAQGHRMAQMDIGGCRIDAELHVQRHAALELLQERRFGHDLRRTGFDNVQLFLRSKHGLLFLFIRVAHDSTIGSKEDSRYETPR